MRGLKGLPIAAGWRFAAIVLPCALGLLLSACSPSGYEAAYAVPETGASVEVRVRQAHPYLAEFERELRLRRGTQVVAKATLFYDSGGYSSANLYRLAPAQYRLTTSGKLSYLIDTAAWTVRAIDAGTDRSDEGGTFVGAFDWFPKETWRFVPAVERGELPVETFKF